MKSLINVIPLAKSDKKRYRAFVDVMEVLGPYPQDHLLIVPTPDANTDMEMRAQSERLMKLFPTAAEVVTLPNNPTGGWPAGPNKHFMQVVAIIANREKQFYNSNRMDRIAPWGWWETDFTPIRTGWMDSLKHDYTYAGKPYYGMLAENRWHIKKGDEEFIQVDGEHMVGCGIYPAHYAWTPGNDTRKFLRPPGGPRNTMWKYPRNTIPFDVRCSREHLPLEVSTKMLHKWRTENYRIEEGQLLCDDVPVSEKEDFGFTNAGPIKIMDLVGIHGCQDGSLSALVASGELDALFPAEAPVAPPIRRFIPRPHKKASAEDIMREVEEEGKTVAESDIEATDMADILKGLPVDEAPDNSIRKIVRRKGQLVKA